MMGHEQTDYLQLADWRRTIAELYAEVRRLAASNPVAAHTHWHNARERLYREHPQSPIPAGQRANFHALHFAYDPALRFEVVLVPDDAWAVTALTDGPDTRPATPVEAPTVAIPTSAGGAMAFRRIGWLEIPFPAAVRRLALFWIEGYAGGLYLPFRDATNGVETYGAGRYVLDAAKSADLGGDPARGTLMLDFNFAYQPSCAFDPRWACPLTPPQNRLDLPIRAGERIA